jgi:putative nucleotidyltransferase with HDIG domain
LLSLFAGQAASVVYNARLLAETQHRLQELEVVNRVSTALRSANTLDEMLPIFLEETLSLFHTNSGNIALFDEQSKVFQTQVTSGWFDNFKTFLPHTDQGISAQVMKGGAIYLSPEFASDPLANPEVHQWIPTGWGGACLPIRSGREIIGLFYIAIELPRRLGDPEIHLLVTLTEMVGNAIHRARLLEKTEKQVARLTALRKVDQAISASLDLRLTLKVLLEQVDSQLKADAACVLLLNPYTLTLEHQSSYGFRTKLIDSQYLRLGEGYASRAILEKKAIHMEALSEEQLDPAFAKLVKAESINSYHVIPLVAKGHVLGVLETYYRAPHQPNQDWFDFFETLAGQAAIAIDNASLFDNLQHSNQNLILAYDRTLEGWARALELRDNETEGHSRRVTEMTLNLARTAGISDENLIHLRRGALLHDIGKMGIPDSILHKPSSLTDEEWVLMRQHPVLAYEMLRSIDYLLPALDIPYCHHEKWDGSGYPRGLKGEEIPLSARIFAVIDVWDALGSDRPYRKAWPREKIVAYIKDESGHHFDPKVVELFFDLLGSSQPVR